MPFTVDQQSAEVKQMARDWPTIEALMGGTLAMRDAGETLLPRWPQEETNSWKKRQQTATLFPAYRRTVSVMGGKPFSKQLTLSKDAPPNIIEWATDIDRQGVNLHTFAAQMFLETLAYGMAGILVESPKAIMGATGGPPTEQDQKNAGIRPYWVRVKHNQVLGWRTLTAANGALTLVQLRIAESATVEDGDYGERVVPRVRVLAPGRFEVFEQQATADGRKEWVSIESGATGLNFIPYVPLYGFRLGFMVGEPPLRELAYLNVKHWQSQSDQDTILHVARVPILFGKVLGDSPVVVGGSNIVKADDINADLKYVEHTGSSITSGKESLSDLEEQMVQCGAELMVKYAGQRTATEDANDAEGNKCDLQRIAEGFEDSLDLALEYTAKYASLATGGQVSLFKDFGAATLSDASAAIIVTMNQNGLLSKETTIREQQRRGVLSPDLDPAVEIAKAQAEGPPPGTLTDSGGNIQNAA